MPFIEASHVAASLAGTGLLLLVPGLYSRLDGAFVATRALLLAGAIFSIAKGLDYEEAIVLFAITAALQWTRKAFYRRTLLTSEALTPGWIAAIAAAVLVSLWIDFFSYKHVEYQDSLWWQFALKDNPSRFLRASMAVAILLATVAVWRLFGAAPSPDSEPVAPHAILPALAVSGRTEAMLAFTGDKRFLMSAAGDAFANIWATRNRAELSVDLMRHGDRMPYGTMDFLFAELMLWGRA